jgi:hypothetical protein
VGAAKNPGVPRGDARPPQCALLRLCTLGVPKDEALRVSLRHGLRFQAGGEDDLRDDTRVPVSLLLSTQ